MKIILSSLFLILPALIYGQDKSVEKYNRIHVGISYSPEYCYRTLIKTDKDLSETEWKSFKSLEDSIEKPKLGHSIGINVSYQLSSKFRLGSGIYFSNKGYKTIPILTYYDWSKPPIVAVSRISYYYLNVPLTANITFLKTRLKIITSLGVDFSFFLKSRVKTTAETPTQEFSEQTSYGNFKYSAVDISPTIGLGAEYNVRGRVTLSFLPTFGFGLIDIDKSKHSSYKSIHLWQAGIKLGCMVGL